MVEAIATPEGKTGAQRRVGKAEQARDAFARMVTDVSRRGFYGAATLTLTVQDGHIQHVKLGVEHVLK